MSAESTSHRVAALCGQFATDPVTMLDAVRTAGESGQEPDPATMEAISSCAGELRRVPRGKLADELLGILVTAHPIVALETMARTGLMARLLPEVDALRRMLQVEGRHKDVYRHTLIVTARTAPDPITRLAGLLHDIGKPATKVVERGIVRFPGHAELGAEMARRRMRQLGIDRAVSEPVTLLVALHLRANSYEGEWTDAAARRLAREAGEHLPRLLDLSRADVTSGRRDAVERALRRVDALEDRIAALRAAEEKPESPLDGIQLMAMFERPPGPWIGAVKNHLAALVGAGELEPEDTDRAAAIARALVDGQLPARHVAPSTSEQLS
jgi:poly(A) polymerase